MPRPSFERGNKLAKGGKRPGAGRPSKKQLASLEVKREQIKQRLADDADGIYGDWRQWIKDSATAANYAIEKILGDEQINTQRPLVINYIQFSNRDNPAIDVSPEALPAAVLAGDGEGQTQSGFSVASSRGERPIVLKLHDNSDANGDGR